jgi:hypothetical protein
VTQCLAIGRKLTNDNHDYKSLLLHHVYIIIIIINNNNDNNNIYILTIFIFIYIWENYNDLTVLPKPGIMVSKGNHPQMALI